jgi:hypothetical protein
MARLRLTIPEQATVSTSDQSKEYTIINKGTGTITLTPTEDTIGGSVTYSLRAKAHVTITENGGTDWLIQKIAEADHADDADHATNADNATNATNATNASNLDVDGTPTGASSTPAPHKIPRADEEGFLDDWIRPLAQQLFRVPDSVVQSFRYLPECWMGVKDGTVRMCGLGGNAALGLGTSVSDHYSPVSAGFRRK